MSGNSSEFDPLRLRLKSIVQFLAEFEKQYFLRLRAG
jgi:hypothetical protein